MKGSNKPIPDGIWLCSSRGKTNKAWVIWEVRGEKCVALKVCERSVINVGEKTYNHGWGRTIITPMTTSHYYKLL